MSGQVAFDAGKPLVGRITDVEIKTPAVEVQPDPKIARDQVCVVGDRQALAQKIEDAFDKRSKAEALIFGRQMQAHIGWNPQNDVAYQQALKDKAAATAEIDKFRQCAPDLVAAEETRRSPAAKAKNVFQKLWDFFKPVPGPLGMPIPSFVKSFFNMLSKVDPKVVQL